MNGRTLLQANLAVALAAAAFVVSSNAAARPQGDAPTSPATPTTTPTTPSSTTEPGADAKKEEGKKEETEDATKKKPPTPANAAPGPEGADPRDASGAAPGKEGMSLTVGDSQPRKDEVKSEAKKSDDGEPSSVPFAGSTFFWDHSVSTQTARLEPSAQQSYNPSYEWWFSFRPYWNFSKKLSYRGRFDLYKDMTNNEESTYYRENRFGDIWNTLRYAAPISERLKNTKYSVSGTIKLPTSKESQAQGVYFKPSIGGGLSQKIPINGESAKWFQSASLSFGATYEHPIAKSTTPTGGGFETLRQDTEGRTFATDQLSGGMLPNHTVLGSLSGGLDITEKWNASLMYILINSWMYTPKDDIAVRTDTGNVVVPRNSDATSFSQLGWLLFTTDYQVIDEMSLGAGYYNIANSIAPNGQRRGVAGSENIWWSPGARVFFTITAHLDKIYERAAGIKKPAKETAEAPTALPKL